MTLLLWLAMGVLVGILARRVIPKMETNNPIFALFIAIVGSIFGGFAAALLGIEASNVIPNLIIAFAGAVFVLFFYKAYLSDGVSQ